ncbi:MAG: c-type cytochrome [Candidatus Thiodiazotropha sp. (ex Lucinoma aequizonata)]|nr:c-type cytochrome [Candidatus Thiodiazotropha sp. (ex Lucinoma aequizonata)]MCU7898667.1 c-type cytochrome [Candidatus Thiodiazotropha sp. (ex Lucinoma aequizonata)]MCU7901273.1 c-type cytochrome [Candidatus Thiodiazotropha sp. (ex Lucinoma aequizonata)]MCU7909960.1 c-type cytochrome [Candidatus Thiodiazotropha sp. (ex Lucinoma aequizonata)]
MTEEFIGMFRKMGKLTTLCGGLLLISLSPNVVADAAAGKAIYDGKGACGSCHGSAGMGDGPAAMAMDPKPLSFTEGVFKYDTDADGQSGTDADLVNIIKNGSAKYGGAAIMPGRADIPDGEIKALVAYIRTLKK